MWPGTRRPGPRWWRSRTWRPIPAWRRTFRGPFLRTETMAIADWFFKRVNRGKDRVDLDLAAVKGALADTAPRLEGKAVEPELVRARLADRCRDVRVEPVAPADFDALARDLDAEGWRRLAVAGSVLGLPAVRQGLGE